MSEVVAISKALSVSDVCSKRYKCFNWGAEWRDAFDCPERAGVWFIWGYSGSGKSTFALQLCAELARHGRVLYNSLEMGSRLAFQRMLSRMPELKNIPRGRLQFIPDMPDALTQRLLRKGSADFVVIDSLQYFGLQYSEYKNFKKRNKERLIVFISHALGTQPAGKSAVSIMFDADLKIWVEGYRAISKGRFIGSNGGFYKIWTEGADRVYGE